MARQRLLPDGGGPAPKRTRRGWRRPLVRLLIVLVSLMLLVPAGLAIANRAAFGTFAFWAAPNRVNFCGRRYYEQGAPQSGTPSEFRRFDSDKSAAWKQVASTFTGRAIYAVVSPHPYPSAVCAIVLYLEDGPNQWIVYPLSGGP